MFKKTQFYTRLILVSLIFLFIKIDGYGIDDEMISPNSNYEIIDFSNFNEDSLSSFLHLAIDRMGKQDYSTAYEILQVVKSKSVEYDSVRINVLANNNIGNIFFYLSSLDSALFYYHIALELAEENEYFDLQNTIINNIGIIYSSLGNSTEAKVFFEKAYAVSLLLNDSIKIAINLTNLASVKIDLKDFEGAYVDLTKSLQISKLQRNKANLISIYNSLGELYYINENYKKALDYYIACIDMTRPNTHNINLPIFYNNIGKSYFAMDSIDKAVIYLDSSYQYAYENKKFGTAILALMSLADIYNLDNKPDKAFAALLLSNSLKDSIIKQERHDLFETSKTRYKFNIKMREYENLRKESENRRLIWIIMISGISIIAFLIFIILRTQLRNQKMKSKMLKEENVQHKVKIKKVQKKNKKLEDHIETINYELMSKSLLIENKNQILDSISKLIKNVDDEDGSLSYDYLMELKQHLFRDNSVDKNLDQFQLYFEKIHSNFFKNLHETHPKLTPNDLRLSAYFLLQFSAKEIGEILNITPGSVRKRKQRLSEKLELDSGDKLLTYLYSFAK